MTVASSIFNSLFDREPPEILWHYTTLEGLKGIVEAQSIWASDVRFLNDKLEYVHALDIFDRLISDRLRLGKPEDKAALGTAQELFSNVWSLDNNQVFVASFSTSDDQLSQWRAYGATTKGVSVGLDLRRLRPDGLEGPNVFAPCIYEPAVQQMHAERWLAIYLEMSKDSRATRSQEGSVMPMSEGPSTGDEEVDRILRSVVAKLSPDWALAFLRHLVDGFRLTALIKHEKFAEENEWRLILSESFNRSHPSPLKRECRIGASTLIPYISIPLSRNAADVQHTSAIKTVKMGPHPDPKRSADAMKSYLKSLIPGVKVESSVVPFRMW